MPSRRVIIDHLTIGVSDLERSRRFYGQVLAPLGFDELGPWTDQVEAFHAAAAAAGGRDKGRPARGPSTAMALNTTATAHRRLRAAHRKNKATNGSSSQAS